MPRDPAPHDLATDDVVDAWFDAHTHRRPDVTANEVARLKRGRRVSAILPARNEESTLGAILDALLGLGGLIDEILVVDSRSTDRTADIARERGVAVVPVEGDPDPGKGGAMRLGVARMTGDVGVFLDADVRDFDPMFPVALLNTLLADDALVFVKGFYARPWQGGGESRPVGGGRVTELVARPLIEQHAPLLGGFAQPLAGEVAFVRSALLGQPFVSGYGVDVALLLGVLERHGLDAMAQVDLGQRLHGHQELDALGLMALQVSAAFDLMADRATEVVRRRTTVDPGDVRLELARRHVHTWLLPPPG